MGFRKVVENLFLIIRKDLLTLLARKSRTEFNPDVFLNPNKYAKKMSTNKIVADSKVYREGVEMYKAKIKEGKEVGAIIVVKHPREDVFAVLDGHHRYFAYKELGHKEICAALAGDYSSVIFYLTKNGYFQPSAEVTKNLRQPIHHVHENLKEFLDNFLGEYSLIRTDEKRRKSN